MPSRPEGIPVDAVRKMREQGISDDKIVESLQRDGYRSSQIFDAMTQADMSIPDNEEEVTSEFPETLDDSMHGPYPSSSQQFHQPRPQMQPPQMQMQPHWGPSAGGQEKAAEELIESIIDEKWEEIEGNIQKIANWKNDTEKKIKDMENDLKSLKEKFDKLHQGVLGKIGEYDKNIMNVGAEIKAMEKAFSKLIPEFSQSVTDLTELVQDLKKDKQSAKKKKK